MASSEIRKLRRKFRDDLHDRLGEFVSITISGTDHVIQGVTARIHDELRQVGDIKGVSLDFAQLHENTPQIVFRISDFTTANPTIAESGLTNWRDMLARGTIIRAEDEDGEPLVYEITDREPIHGITVNVNVTRVAEKKACLFALPEVPEICPDNT